MGSGGQSQGNVQTINASAAHNTVFASEYNVIVALPGAVLFFGGGGGGFELS